MRAFFGNPYAKGQYEYLNARKKQQLRFALICAFFVAAFVITGLVLFHNTKNILSVPGALMVLPMANFLVTYIALLKGKELTPERREAVRAYEESGMALFHLMYVDEKGKRFFLEHAVVYQNAIVAYAPSVEEKQRVGVESDCIVRLKKKNINLRLKLYADWEDYLGRLSDIAPEVREEQVKLVERAEEQLLAMCL